MRCFLVSFCSEANNSSISQACTWQEHVTLKWLRLLATNFGIKTVCVYVCLRVCACVCVGGGCLYVFCKKSQSDAIFCLSSTRDSVDSLALNPSYLLLSILSLSLVSLGRVKNASSSKIHFTFRQFAEFFVIVLLEWVHLLPKKMCFSESHSLMVFGLGDELHTGLLLFAGHVFK